LLTNDIKPGISDAESDHAYHDPEDGSIKTNVSLDLCIELGSGHMIDIDEDANLFVDNDENS
jgi:hypothetical protein